MSVKMIEFLETRMGSISFSILLGVGIAALFRKACTDNKCIIIQSPDMEELSKFYYKSNGKCFKYTPVTSECA